MASNRRPSKEIQLVKRILVLTEGEESEKIYLNGFRGEEMHRRKLSGLIIEQPKNHDPLGLVREAKKRIKESKKLPFDSVWVVFDKNGHANRRAAFEEARTFKPEINVAFSSICFEFWILLHFEKTRKHFGRCDDVKRYLKEHHFPDYSKTSNFYPTVKQRMDMALQHADWLHKENKTDIERGMHLDELQAYISFDRLMNYLIDIVSE